VLECVIQRSTGEEDAASDMGRLLVWDFFRAAFKIPDDLCSIVLRKKKRKN
jgi:hypothetical protein